jgi:hypothetical protein
MIRLLLVLLVCSSCSWFKSEAKTVARDVVDCTTAKAKAAVVAYAPLVETVVIESIDAAGRADWTKIKTAASGVGSTVVDRGTRELFGCAMQAVVNRLLDPQLLEGRPQSEPVAVDRAALAAGWDETRTQLFGGVYFAGAQ